MSVTAHGFSDGAIIYQHDISGTTEANGVFQITYVDENSYSLNGTTYANAYVSGGYAYQRPESPQEIKRIIMADTNIVNDLRWYPRGSKIIVADEQFTNDILIDYEKAPDSISDIPAEYHEGLVALAVIKLIKIPVAEDPSYQDMMASKSLHETIFNMMRDSISSSLKISSEPQYVKNVWFN
jgi:hypothetical protein